MKNLGTDRPGVWNGRHVRSLALATAIVGVATGVPASAATLSPDLSARTASASTSDRVPVIAVLAHQVQSQHSAGGRAALQRRMRLVAHRQQRGMNTYFAGGGRVRHLWIVNAVVGDATRAQIAEMARDPRIRSLSMNASIKTQGLALEPLTDPGSGNWGVADTRAPQTWKGLGLDGKGVTIGSIDTGVEPTNPALAGKVVRFKDFVHNRATPYDDNGHGTHTIGVMVGGTTTGTPVGIAPGARVVVAKAMDQDGAGDGGALLAAAQWMTDPDGNPATADQPTVVNNSWSAPNANDPWFRDMLRSWLALGIVPVFAAGNTGTVGSPAGYPEAIAVGAHDQKRALWQDSGRSTITWQALDGTGPPVGTVFQKPDLTAPGVLVMGTYGTGYMTFTGTSMASPHVAAGVALIRQANPALTPEEISDILRRTATDIGTPGRDLATGAGALNIEAAVYTASNKPVPAPTEVPAPGLPVLASPDDVTAAQAKRGVMLRKVSTGRKLRGLHVVAGSPIRISAVSRTDTKVTVTMRDLKSGKVVRKVVLAKGKRGFVIQVRGVSRHRYALRIQTGAPSRPVAEYSGTVAVR